MLRTEVFEGGFQLFLDERCIISHSENAPAVFLGTGHEHISMYRGNFKIRDSLMERDAMHFTGGGKDMLCFHSEAMGDFCLSLSVEDGLLRIKGKSDKANRIWLRFEADAKEHILGGGEQFSFIDLRGRSYPIWTREQGVGRNKLTEVTRLADCEDGGGGDYHTSFFPQPTFISSRLYFAHLENYCYSVMDFREEDYHELEIWSGELSLVLSAGESYAELLYKLTGLLGRQPVLPDWAMKGVWLGIQGGTERTTDIEKRCKAAGMDVSAVWIQDWEGKRVTSFGKRLQWDWRWNKEMYPHLDEVIHDDASAWMGYINPYLVEGGVLFKEAAEKGYFVKKADGSDYLFDFGEFDCGVVDLTSPAAFEWYKNVIKQNLIGMGFKGWMADFGEYLPADAVCANGESGMTAHNEWPMLWAKCNREAVEESGLLGDCVFFMRAGAAGSQRYATLIWAGDQCVDWSEDDGLPSVITAAISLGMSGYGVHTCDAGGYTTLFHLARDKELLLRWLEFACFTPVLRTHEGNRPDTNVQLYSDEELISASARLSRLHTGLLPYMRHCVEENSALGLPVMRGLFMAAPNEDKAYQRENYSYLLGSDVLVAPVVKQGETKRTVWLPEGEWRHMWSGEDLSGTVTVDAPLGKPPVFYRVDSCFAPLFEKLAADYC